MLLPSAEVPTRPGPRAAADVVVVVTGRDRGHVAGAIALARRRRVPLHLVVPTSPPRFPWAVLLGARPVPGAAVASVIAQAAAAGVHVEVHRAPRRLHALAAGIAETVGGEAVRPGGARMTRR